MGYQDGPGMRVWGGLQVQAVVSCGQLSDASVRIDDCTVEMAEG
jgi:hypothetical protein